ncbi:hypothetical protein Pmani_023332 [Petrolisthes manimaculis]|uniref:acylphosphatase n=1 Tax=Petrolisthes manimaculis TaxID=1843537 RepID=A0AAE1PA46_9EUCA|nr:hypothetical protein Pmani_023332 [Petrolisthes manimaculis]
MAAPKLLSVDFEVFGLVQGVCFRQVSSFGRKDWLSNIGSRASRIERAEFKNEKEIQDYTFKKFTIRH